MQKIKEVWRSISELEGKEKFFLFFAMLCGFLISADYAIIRPVSNSLVIHQYGSKIFPYVWLVSLPFNLAVVSLYNYLLPKIGCFKLFIATSVAIIGGNLYSAAYISDSTVLPFAFYIWKDVYVLLMFQQLWSVIHATMKMQNAAYLYGFLFGVGALGAFFGSFVPGFFAVKMGSEFLLNSTAPIYLLLAGAYFGLLRCSNQVEKAVSEKTKQGASLPQGCKLIFSSKLLTAILLITAFMQITATVTDFQFQTYLENAYPEKDIRTALFGRIACLGNILTMFFQFVGTFLLVHFFGLQKTHLLVPILLGCNAITFLFFPVLGVMTYSFLMIKCFDFSVFSVIKEMLYIPLRVEEKFQAKALIDVFITRASKAIASFFILFLQYVFSGSTLVFLSWINLSIFALWCVLIVSIKSSYPAPDKLPVSPQL
jgi:AAA family ATP:ADP antiporter